MSIEKESALNPVKVLAVPVMFSWCTDKKEKEIILIFTYSILRKYRCDRLKSHIYEEGLSTVIYVEMSKYLTMRRPFVIYDFAIDPF